MNTKIALAAIAIVSALALVVAPAMVESALATKTKETVCPSGNPCQGASGEHNPNIKVTCKAGSKDQTNANCP